MACPIAGIATATFLGASYLNTAKHPSTSNILSAVKDTVLAASGTVLSHALGDAGSAVGYVSAELASHDQGVSFGYGSSSEDVGGGGGRVLFE